MLLQIYMRLVNERKTVSFLRQLITQYLTMRREILSDKKKDKNLVEAIS